MRFMCETHVRGPRMRSDVKFRMKRPMKSIPKAGLQGEEA